MPAAAAKEKGGEEPVKSATEVPSASGSQVNNLKVKDVCVLAVVEALMF